MVQVVEDGRQVEWMVAPVYVPRHAVFDSEHIVLEHEHVEGLNVLLLHLLVGLLAVVFPQVVFFEGLLVDLHKMAVALVFWDFR